jgi:hypothetical protein
MLYKEALEGNIGFFMGISGDLMLSTHDYLRTSDTYVLNQICSLLDLTMKSLECKMLNLALSTGVAGFGWIIAKAFPKEAFFKLSDRFITTVRSRKRVILIFFMIYYTVMFNSILGDMVY